MTKKKNKQEAAKIFWADALRSIAGANSTIPKESDLILDADRKDLVKNYLELKAFQSLKLKEMRHVASEFNVRHSIKHLKQDIAGS